MNRSGWLAERPKAAVLKTVVGHTTGGSNPSPSATAGPRHGSKVRWLSQVEGARLLIAWSPSRRLAGSNPALTAHCARLA